MKKLLILEVCSEGASCFSICTVVLTMTSETTLRKHVLSAYNNKYIEHQKESQNLPHDLLELNLDNIAMLQSYLACTLHLSQLQMSSCLLQNRRLKLFVLGYLSKETLLDEGFLDVEQQSWKSTVFILKMFILFDGADNRIKLNYGRHHLHKLDTFDKIHFANG